MIRFSSCFDFVKELCSTNQKEKNISMRNKYLYVVILLLLVSCKNEINEKIINGEYPTLTTPSDSAIVFADNFISTNFNERDMTL